MNSKLISLTINSSWFISDKNQTPPEPLMSDSLNKMTNLDSSIILMLAVLANTELLELFYSEHSKKLKLHTLVTTTQTLLLHGLPH